MVVSLSSVRAIEVSLQSTFVTLNITVFNQCCSLLQIEVLID